MHGTDEGMAATAPLEKGDATTELTAGIGVEEIALPLGRSEAIALRAGSVDKRLAGWR